MDIHRPKPWHGLREFLKEYVIIVVGVLTALGAEQTVELIHTAYKATEAETAVREEFARNVALIQDRLNVSDCNREQFKAVDRLLIATPPDQPVAPMPYAFIFSRPFSWPQWESAVSTGIAGHFPEERRGLYRRIYGNAGGYRSFDASEAVELDAAAKLRTLRLPARKLDAATREGLLQAAAQAEYQEERIAHNAADLLIDVGALHLPPPKFAGRTKLFGPEAAKTCMEKVLAEEAAMPPLPAPKP
jgi:hypothetical protein